MFASSTPLIARHPQQRGRVAADVANLEQRRASGRAARACRASRGRATTPTGSGVSGTSDEEELRRIDVSLLLLEDRIVERRIGRLPVEHGVGRGQVREPDVPGEEAFIGAQRDDARPSRRPRRRRARPSRARARDRRRASGPRLGGVGGRPHRPDDGRVPEGVCTRMRLAVAITSSRSRIHRSGATAHALGCRR